MESDKTSLATEHFVWSIDSTSNAEMPLTNVTDNSKRLDKVGKDVKFTSDLETFVNEKICDLADHPSSEAPI